MKRLFASLAVLAAALGMAQKVSPESIIVNPTPTDLSVKTWVDKDPAKRGNSIYQVGENITIYAQVNQDAYVYLFGIAANGKIDLILPNSYDSDNFLRRNETRRYPPAGGAYQFRIDPPEGLNRVLALASKRPLALSQVADVARGEVKVAGAENLGRALSIIVEPVPSKDWVSDLASFYVGRITAPDTITPVPTRSTLEVTSNPSGAQVFLNGQLSGATPLTTTLNAGRVDVEVRLAGYATYQTTVTLQTGQTTSIRANLVAERRSSLEVNSTPSGAQVFIDGTRAGVTPLQLALSEGTYDLRIVADGYLDYRTTVQINRDLTTRINATLTALRRTGNLEVNSTPSGAEVYLNNSRVGVTPYRATLDEGSYEVRVVRSGYAEYRTSIRIEQGRSVTLSPILVLIPLKGTLEVNSTPSGAEVYLNNSRVGVTPYRATLDEGTYELRVVRSGYTEYRTSVRIEQGRTLTLSPVLVPIAVKGTLEIITNQATVEARVFVNGTELGKTVGGNLILSLDNGNYEITVVAPGYRSVIKTVRIRANERETLRITLNGL